MIVSISGSIASGKSTVAKELAKNLGWQRIYVGQIRRELADSKNMTLEELNNYALNHPETDIDVDKLASQKAIQLEKSGINVVVEGRVQFHLLPSSFKIFISCSQTQAALRIFKQLQADPTGIRSHESSARTLEEIKLEIQEREANDTIRFRKYYGIDHTDPSHYDLCIDSSSISAAEVLEKILKKLQKHLP